MPLRFAMLCVLVAALAISPVMAHPQQADPERWRAFAAQLPPNALVTVHLTSGERVEGHVVHVTTDSLRVNPKTRIAVPVRDLPFETIQSVDREKEGMHWGWKVAIWGAVAFAATMALLYALMPSN